MLLTRKRYDKEKRHPYNLILSNEKGEVGKLAHHKDELSQDSPCESKVKLFRHQEMKNATVNGLLSKLLVCGVEGMALTG